MQKLWFGLFGLIITTDAFAADLCVRNDAMVVAMNPMYNGTANGSDSVNKTWSTGFSYGTISGIAACADDCNTMGCVATNQNMTVYGNGSYCYCKMLKPALSPWIHSGGYRYGSGVYNSCYQCVAGCAINVATVLDFRRALFHSVNELD